MAPKKTNKTSPIETNDNRILNQINRLINEINYIEEQQQIQEAILNSIELS